MGVLPPPRLMARSWAVRRCRRDALRSQPRQRISRRWGPHAAALRRPRQTRDSRCSRPRTSDRDRLGARF